MRTPRPWCAAKTRTPEPASVARPPRTTRPSSPAESASTTRLVLPSSTGTIVGPYWPGSDTTRVGFVTSTVLSCSAELPEFQSPRQVSRPLPSVRPMAIGPACPGSNRYGRSEGWGLAIGEEDRRRLDPRHALVDRDPTPHPAFTAPVTSAVDFVESWTGAWLEVYTRDLPKDDLDRLTTAVPLRSVGHLFPELERERPAQERSAEELAGDRVIPPARLEDLHVVEGMGREILRRFCPSASCIFASKKADAPGLGVREPSHGSEVTATSTPGTTTTNGPVSASRQSGIAPPKDMGRVDPWPRCNLLDLVFARCSALSRRTSPLVSVETNGPLRSNGEGNSTAARAGRPSSPSSRTRIVPAGAQDSDQADRLGNRHGRRDRHPCRLRPCNTAP